MIPNEQCREVLAEACRSARQSLINNLASTMFRWSGDTYEELASAVRDLPSELQRLEERAAAAMSTDFEAIQAFGPPPDWRGKSQEEARKDSDAHYAKLNALVTHVQVRGGE